MFKGVDQATLSRKQKRMALRAINLINKKRCGKLRGRTVADGSVQRDMYIKKETASSTVSNDALMLKMLVDALQIWMITYGLYPHAPQQPLEGC